MSPIQSPWRWAAAAVLLATAGFHLPLVPEHLAEARYIGVGFLGLSVVSVALAVVLIARDTALAWVASGVVALAAVVAFLASRTVGLPQIHDDIGNWSEPLAVPALAVEVLTVAFASALALIHAAPAPGRRNERTTI